MSAADFSNLPPAMLQAKRWLLWKCVPNKDPAKKDRKIPFYTNGQPRSGDMDTPHDTSRFASLEEALRVFETRPGKYSGLGFALGDGWQGIDLDDFAKHPELRELAKTLPGYLEYSPGGDGVHAIGYGKPFTTLGSNDSGIECYSSGRYFTVTGKALRTGPLTDIADFVSTELVPLHAMNGEPSEKTTTKTPKQPPAASDDCLDGLIPPQTVEELREALLYLPADDYGEWIAVGQALRSLGDVGREIWNDWGATSSMFDPDEAAAKWESFTGDRTGYAAIFAKAQAAGWVNPAKGTKAKKAKTKAAKAQAFTFKSAAEIMSTRRSIDWQIEGHVEKDSTTYVFGQTGTLKSFLVIDQACCTATGTPWCGCNVARGPAFYIAGEGHSGLSRRLKAWELYHGVDLSDAPLFFSEQPAQFLDKSSADAVAKAVEQLAADFGSPRLIIIDTLAKNLGDGDESSAADIGRFQTAIDGLRHQYGAAVIVVHHVGHGSGAQDRGRGSSALKAGVDGEYQMYLDGDDGVVMHNTKAKDFSPPSDLRFRKQEVVLPGWADETGELLTSLVLIPTDAAPVAMDQPRGPIERAITDGFADLSRVADVTEDDLVSFVAQGLPRIDSTKRDRRRFVAQRALGHLVDIGFFRIEEGQVHMEHGT